MSMRKEIIVFGLLLLCTSPAAADNPVAKMPPRHSVFLKNYCLNCHDTDTQTGKIDLERLSFDLGTIESAESGRKCSMP